MPNQHHVLGIDVGASGIKGAIIDVQEGKLLTERLRVPTPQPATPEAMTNAFAELVSMFDYDGACVGVGFPSIVRRGMAMSAANIHPDWIRTSITDLWGKAINKRVFALNDADAAGLASVSYGSAKAEQGVVAFLTIGTGIGSAIFINGILVPNSELGHIYMPNGMKSEHYASNRVRKTLDLDWKTWGCRFDEVLAQVDRILSPDLILLGGGASKRFDLYEEYLNVSCEVRPAKFRNEAGAIGAALYAAEKAGIVDDLETTVNI